MPYSKTTWTDEVPASTPIKYAITGDVEGELSASATIEIVTSVTAGTAVNATNLNKIETGIETAQAAAEAAQSTATAAIPKSLATAIGQIAYSTASAVWAALSKPTVTSILQNNSSGSLAWRTIKQTVQIQIVGNNTEVDTGTGIGYFVIPSTLNGMDLVRAQAVVLTAGTTNFTSVQVRNLTKYPSNDALSMAISINTGATIGVAGTVNTSYDDVSTNDIMKVYVTAQTTTKPLGLLAVLEFQLP